MYYLLSPAPPLTRTPAACLLLTVAELKHNLQAHAAYNPEISIVGTKAQLCARLERLLTTRVEDLAVRDMVRSSMTVREAEGAAGGVED